MLSQLPPAAQICCCLGRSTNPVRNLRVVFCWADRASISVTCCFSASRKHYMDQSEWLFSRTAGSIMPPHKPTQEFINLNEKNYRRNPMTPTLNASTPKLLSKSKEVWGSLGTSEHRAMTNLNRFSPSPLLILSPSQRLSFRAVIPGNLLRLRCVSCDENPLRSRSRVSGYVS